ncbi:Acetyltransferase (GNAT) domain-containing protein [Cyclobacterium lianum]|uniref:Acetyltransferase (GNAT) domain-containing protein n=1 Tax=Cyclobacterium lianum TaxID=388280 RepID=A0A1M7KAA1_9BACT|nr:GNAT family N-acetyltransferase [Cyclobacterium lianum]SHM62196.1 Acetyltransferase (GNAT) domain-containing protein [Cyclobacterium lianum]
MRQNYSSPLSEIRIRNHFEPGDIGTIIGLHGRLYHDTYGFGLGFEKYVARTFAEFACNFQETKDKIWIAAEGRTIKGCIALVDRGELNAQLRYFIVTPDVRGQGLGRLLFGSYMQHIHDHGYETVYLWTTANLQAAASLYLDAGFRLAEQKSSDTFGLPLLEQRYVWEKSK